LPLSNQSLVHVRSTTGVWRNLPDATFATTTVVTVSRRPPGLRVVGVENDGGRLKATRIVEYFRDQQVLDERLGWGLRWVAGRKD